MKNVLIVDDTKNIRMLLQKTMELEGFSVETAANGTDALEKILSNEYSLIFLDIKLPELSGTEVLRKIREEGINTPIIIMTAYATIKNAVDCIQLGAITYLQKPFTADRLRNVLKQFNISPVSEESSNADIWLEIERTYKDKNYRHTLRLLSSMLADEPENPRIYRLMSKCCMAMGDNAKAEKYRKAASVFEEQ